MPQGSLLGPRLFNIHVFDLPEVPSKGELEMFADNTEHYVTGNTVDEIAVIIEDVLHEVSEWCKQNCLTSVPARPPKVIQKAIFNNIQSESCDEVEIAA